MNIVLLTMILGMRLQVWTEPTLVQVVDATERSEEAARNARLYAARGEWESFQLCVRAGSKGLNTVRIEAEPLGKMGGTRTVRRVGFIHVPTPSRQSFIRQGYWPDVLVDAAPFDLAPGEMTVFWITYYVPPETPAGVYKGRVQVKSANRRAHAVDVRMEVFDFTLPQRPSLPVCLWMDRAILEQFYGLEPAMLEDWKPIYDMLAPYRVSLGLWNGGRLVPMSGAGGCDTTALKEHMSYVMKGASMACLELGGAAGSGLAELREAGRLSRAIAARNRAEAEKAGGGAAADAPASGLDTVYLKDMASWIKEEGWTGLAMAEVAPLESRSRWPELRDAYDAFGKVESGVARLLVGPPYPYFQRYVDQWAILLPDYSPEFAVRCWQGQSLATPVAHPAKAVVASSNGVIAHHPESESAPEDAYDGCLSTAWTSNHTPSKAKPEWLQLDFAEPLTTSTMNLFWSPGLETEAIDVLTSFDGTIFTAATVNWEHRGAFQPYEQTMAVGTFKYENTFSAIRIVFRGSFAGGPVGLAEVTFGSTVDTAMPAPNASIAPWLALSPEYFPSPCADAHPAQLRSAPWICWGQKLAGVVYGGLNRWPEMWGGYIAEPPGLWTGGEDGRDFLLYPGPQKPLASVRLERLRDGLEDYEYLNALAQAASEGREIDPELGVWLGGRLYNPGPDSEELDALSTEIMETRVAIGRALSRK